MEKLKRLTPPMLLTAFFAAVAPVYFAFGWLIIKFSPAKRLNSEPGRIAWADGIRGLLAISVVWGHCSGVTVSLYHIDKWPIYMGVNTGFTAVPFFLFLSGFVLVLPTVKRGLILGSLWQYIERRANRILPAFYAALVLSLLLACNISHLYTWAQVITQDRDFTGTFWLLTDMPGWGESVFNGPMWSLPYEVHFYFLLPAILWLFRRVGPHWATFVLVTASLVLDQSLGYYAQYLFPVFVLGAYCAWYLGSNQPLPPKATLQKIMWVTLALFYAFCAQNQTRSDYSEFRALLAVVFAGWLCLLFAHLSQSPEGRLRALLESPVCLALGTISYSLYLVHWPIEYAFGAMLGTRLPAMLEYLTLIAVAGGCSILIATVFYYLFERSYLLRRKKSIGTEVQQLEVQPAVTGAIAKIAVGKS